jgi:hypothetical protein
VVLPARIEDGRRLDQVLHPWLMTGIASSISWRTRADRVTWRELQIAAIAALGWLVVPLALVVMFWRTTVVASPMLSVAQGAAVVAATACSTISWVHVARALRKPSSTPRWAGSIPFVTSIPCLLVLMLLGCAWLSARDWARPRVTAWAVDLRGGLHRGVKLPGATLQGSKLDRAVLSGANLRGALLRDNEMRGIELEEADLHDSSFSNCIMVSAKLNRAHLEREGCDRGSPGDRDATARHSASVACGAGCDVGFGPKLSTSCQRTRPVSCIMTKSVMMASTVMVRPV